MPFQTRLRHLPGLLFCALAAVSPLGAQSTAGWLRYAIPPDPPRYHALPHAVVLLGNSAGQAAPEELTAADELDRGLGHMVAGTDVVLHRFDPRIDAIVLGTTEALHRARIGRALPGWVEKPLPEEGFRIVHLRRGIREWYILQGGSPRAELWAAFRFAALVAEDQQLPEDFTDVPHLPLRALDVGRAADVLPLLEAASAHAALPRLLASVGINGLFLNSSAAEAERIASAVQPYGIRVWMRTGSSTPNELAGLAATIPNFGGAIVTSTANESLPQLRADIQAANTLALGLQRYGASVILQDALGPPLLEPSANQGRSMPSPEDRAGMLRGKLEPDVVLMGVATPQPLSGLGSANFGLLPGAPQLAAFDVLTRRPDTLAYPAPFWAAVLQTPERGPQGATALATLLAGANETGPRGGMVGTLSPSDVEHMLQQPLLMANLYAFGRLAWSPTLNVDAVTDEWSRQTWGDDARVHGVATRILLNSGEAAVNNSAPLGLPLLAGVSGSPEPAEAAHIFYGQTPLADSARIGVDRTSTGTDEAARYPQTFAARLSDPAQCPEPWLLLFHRLRYSDPLPKGGTVAQAFYNAHFRGAELAGNAADAWEDTRGLMDEPRWKAVNAFLARAAVHAEIWRETTTEWMQATSGVRDMLGFVDSHTGRVEAVRMHSSGYIPATDVRSPADAKRMICRGGQCVASTTFDGGENVYRVEIGYLDEHLGGSYELRINGEVRAHWQDSATGLPTEPERFVVNGVRLKNGDTVAVRAVVSGKAMAPLDFVEITRDPRWN